MSNVWHPDDDLLIPWLDGELDQIESSRVSQHLSGCRECGEHLASLRAVHYEIVRLAPQPPAPWADLRSRLHDLDAGQTVQRRRSSFHFPVKWAAMAAALVIGALVFRLSTSQTVSAAELLRDASAAELQSEPAKRIRVKTRRAVFTRPASGDIDNDIARLFIEAGYNWNEPLSARSFSGWRNRLSKKDDRVRVLGDRDSRMYRIVTSTEEGSLAEASITLRADDLRAVDSSFRFRNNEIVDITEEAQAGGIKPVPEPRLADSVRPSQSGHQPAAERDATPSDELRVLAALHAIGADLGEPIEVKREKSSITVSALIPDAERQAQIRTSLAGIPLVDLRFEQPEEVRGAPRAAGSASAPKTNALVERLTTQMGGRDTVENFINHVLDLSEAALSRAHALRSLAERFPPPAENTLSETDKRTLGAIQDDHAKKLFSSVRQLTEVLKPLAVKTPERAGAEPFPNWQSGSEQVLEAARNLDRNLTNALAGSGEIENPEEALNRLAGAAAELNAQVRVLQTTLAASVPGAAR